MNSYFHRLQQRAQQTSSATTPRFLPPQKEQGKLSQEEAIYDPFEGEDLEEVKATSSAVPTPPNTAPTPPKSALSSPEPNIEHRQVLQVREQKSPSLVDKRTEHSKKNETSSHLEQPSPTSQPKEKIIQTTNIISQNNPISQESNSPKQSIPQAKTQTIIKEKLVETKETHTEKKIVWKTTPTDKDQKQSPPKEPSLPTLVLPKESTRRLKPQPISPKQHRPVETKPKVPTPRVTIGNVTIEVVQTPPQSTVPSQPSPVREIVVSKQEQEVHSNLQFGLGQL